MGDFNDRNEAITLEDYRAMEARGEITRPLTWPCIRLPRRAPARTDRQPERNPHTVTDTPPPLTPATLHAQARELHALAERLTQRTAPILAHFLPCVELLPTTASAAARTDSGPTAPPTASHPERRPPTPPDHRQPRRHPRPIGVLAGLLERFTGELDGMEAVMFRTAGPPRHPRRADRDALQRRDQPGAATSPASTATWPPAAPSPGNATTVGTQAVNVATPSPQSSTARSATPAAWPSAERMQHEHTDQHPQSTGGGTVQSLRH